MNIYEFPCPNEENGYKIFPNILEDDPLVYFHGTSLKNLESIISGGFKSFPPLSSVSYAKQSNYSLSHWYSKRGATEDGVVFAVRFETLAAPGIKENNLDIHVYDLKIQPDIIGYCIIPYKFVYK